MHPALLLVVKCTNCAFSVRDSRARALHWNNKDWSAGGTYEPSAKNVGQPKRVNEGNIIMSPLHIKFGLVKIFIKAFYGHW